MKQLHLNIPITKVDEDQRIVVGYATTEDIDSQGDIVDYEASKKAFKSWKGNVREMHDPTRAVGKAIDVQFDDAKKAVLVSAQVSRSADGDNAWQKVKEGILTGFSIGGQIFKTAQETKKSDDGEQTVNRITDYALSETSLVDNPANPGAELIMVKSVDGNLQRVEVMEEGVKHPQDWWMGYIARKEVGEIEFSKRSFSADDRKRMAASGQAMPDGSFPIANKEDLQNAIKAYGRAKDKAAAKAHITKRAKALGLTSLLPDGWNTKTQEGDMKKGIYDAARMVDIACQLQSIIDKERSEGEDTSELEEALARVKSAAAEEVMENDDMGNNVSEAMLYAQQLVNLRKDNPMADEPKQDETTPTDAPAAPAEEKPEEKKEEKTEETPKEAAPEAPAETPKEETPEEKSAAIGDLKKSVDSLQTLFKERAHDELAKAVGSLKDAVESRLGSMEREIESLKKTAAPSKIQASFTEVAKGEEEDSGLQELEKRQEEMVKNPQGFSPSEKAQLTQDLIKARRALKQKAN